MRVPAAILLLCLCGPRCLSQEQSSRHAVSAEVFGVAGYGSVNYEHFFSQKEERFLAFRIGLAFVPKYVKVQGQLGLPQPILGFGLPHGVTVNFGRKNYFETGMYGNFSLLPDDAEPTVYKYYYLGPMIWYRRQTPEWFFRVFAAANYTTGPEDNFFINGGLAFGLPFSKLDR
jgi:hypothetical protein